MRCRARSRRRRTNSPQAGARHAGLVARHASAQEELANLRRVAEENGRRERQLRRLVDEARSELVRLEGENEQVQQLNRAVTAADALLRDAEAAWRDMPKPSRACASGRNCPTR